MGKFVEQDTTASISIIINLLHFGFFILYD